MLQRLSVLLVLASMSVFGSSLAAKAETPSTNVSTSAADLVGQPSNTPEKAPTQVAQTQVAQTIDPGRPTRGVSSYIGVAGNIGLGGDSALGDTNFTVISKIGLTNTLSVRPSVVIGDDPVVLVPLTYDLNTRTADAFEDTFAIAPFVGAGVAIETSEDADVGLLLTGGVDVPLSRNFTANATVNAAFLSETDVGLVLGVGYNFNGL
ncbi:hypothetical protein NIES4071_14670 [Calothrix sp. NIES-4071]|nr:hypothetical protein NIES4071_14670 [Calothrix sp. NIES-4071]BAZ55804.1 hypothetical protein NIES4105_14620 [Calothrix sp. NIES-4105]